MIINNNEEGFSYDNVVSICSINDSTKIGDNKTIGQKGLGFKSVFLTSDTPIIISNG